MSGLDLERVRMNWRYAEKHAFVYPQLIAAIPDLLAELERLEGDLAAAEHPGVDVPVRRAPRPGRECGEEHSRGRAGRVCLWRRSETTSLLELGGVRR